LTNRPVIDCCMCVQHKAKEQTTGMTVFLIVLSVTDALICWWISLMTLDIWLLFILSDICCVLFFSRSWSEGWPHHGRTFSVYTCPLSFWLTLSWGVLSMSCCWPSRPCMVFLPVCTLWVKFSHFP